MTADSLSNPPKGEPFKISRTFAAPRSLVWEVWTDVEHFKQWFGPRGCIITSVRGSFERGQTLLYSMRMPTKDEEMWGKWVLQKVDAPRRLVFVSCFSDAAGGVTRHPFAPTWPLHMLSTITFEEADGRTTIHVEWLPINPTDDEQKAFADAKSGMTQGWAGTFENLTEHLLTVQNAG